MKVLDAILMADRLRDNAIDREQKLVWLNELELKIQSRILRTAPDDMIEYDLNNDEATEMLVPRPFDKVYYLWLCAMIDYGNAEFDKYQNDMAMANAAYDDYAKWFMRLFHSDPQNVLYIGGTTKYGLSAYQIACNHGFVGTEAEWVESLHGKDAYTAAVEYGYAGTEEEFNAQLGALAELEEIVRVSAEAASSDAAKAEKAKSSAAESEGNAKAYAEGGTVQKTTYDESGHLAGITATEVTGAKGYQSKAAENAASARKLMLRAKAYAEGGSVEQEPIDNVLYPAVDTIGAKGYMEQAQAAAGRAEAAALEVEGVVTEAADAVRDQVAADADRAALAAQGAQEAWEQVESVVANAADAIRDEVKTDADAAQRAAEEAKKAAASAGIPTDGDEGDVLTKTANGTVWKPAGGGAVYTLVLSEDEADAQANTDAVTAAVAEYKHVMLKPGDYPVKPGIVIESGKLDMNGAHFYTVDYKSETPLVYLRGEAPEICNGELEGSYDLADDEEGYEFFEKERLIRPEGVNGAYIHHMDLHNNWGYCISPGENVQRVYAETATKTGANDFFFSTDAFDIPEGYKYVTAAGGIGYNYIISVSPVAYVFYDESGASIAKIYGVPRKRIVIPSGAKTVAFTTALESETFVTYYAYFTNYEETLTVSDCKFRNFHSLGMANMPGPTTVTRCSFIESGKPRSDANPTSRATTGGIDIEDTQTPELIMSDCYSRDCAKLLMFGGYKGVISNCVGDAIGIYRGWQCDISCCNVSNLYTMGDRCRIGINSVHADLLRIKQVNAKDVRGNISTNSINTEEGVSDVFGNLDSFVVNMSSNTETHGRLSGRLNGIVRSVSDGGIRWKGVSAEKGSRLIIDSTLHESARNYYGTLNVSGDTYGLISNVAFLPMGYAIHDSVFNIAAATTLYWMKDGYLDGDFENCVFNLTGAAYFRKFTGTLTVPIALTFENCTINNADNYLFNFIPDAGGVVTFKNCTIADESKLFNGDVSGMTINIFAGESGVDIDASLSVEGAAADAKAVGAAVDLLNDGKLPAPDSAEIGQYFRVSAVDENGKVTAVEAVAAPSGSDTWETIFTDEKTGIETQKVIVQADNNGNTFLLKKIRLWIAARANGQTFNYPMMRFYNADGAEFEAFPWTSLPAVSNSAYYGGMYLEYDAERNTGIAYFNTTNAYASTAVNALTMNSISKILMPKIDVAGENISGFWFGINTNNLTDYYIKLEGVRV